MFNIQGEGQGHGRGHGQVRGGFGGNMGQGGFGGNMGQGGFGGQGQETFRIQGQGGFEYQGQGGIGNQGGFNQQGQGGFGNQSGYGAQGQGGFGGQGQGGFGGHGDNAGQGGFGGGNQLPEGWGSNNGSNGFSDFSEHRNAQEHSFGFGSTKGRHGKGGRGMRGRGGLFAGMNNRKRDEFSQFGVDLPAGFEESSMRRYDQGSALQDLGFYFPGLQTNTVSEQANWTRIQDPSQTNTEQDDNQDISLSGNSDRLNFDISQIDKADLGIQQQAAEVFMTDVFQISNVADIDSRKKELDPDPRHENDDPTLDIQGDTRYWNNWVVPTFMPTGTSTSPQIEDKQQCPYEGEEVMMERITATPKMTRSGAYQCEQETNSFATTGQKYRTLVNELFGQTHTDKQFPANFSSLYGFGEGGQPRSDYDKLKWERPGGIFKGDDYTVFTSGIHPNDIEQGGLGDCYLLSALSSIAEVPERITRIICSKDVNSSGAYCIALCITGIWEEIIIDDLIPVRPYSQKPAFNSSKSNELWVMLVEKAWAKVNGGYNNIVGGLIREVLHDLTGAPAVTFFNCEGTPEEHWQNLLEGERNNFIMAAGTDDIQQSGDDSQDKKTGLAGNHAYSLLGAYEIVEEGGTKRALRPHEPSNPLNERIVKLRNPWGQGEWNGDWSDLSEKWTDDLKIQLQAFQNDDGVFFIGFDNFRRYYYDYQICYYHENYSYSAQKYNSSPSEPTVVSFKLSSAGAHYFTTNQINKRMFKKSDNYTYSQLTLFVVQDLGHGKMKYIGSVSKSDKEMWFKANCEAGKYMAYVMTPWKRNVNEFSFSVYGPDATTIDLVRKEQVPPALLDCIMIEKAKKSSSGLRSFEQQGESEILYKFESGSDSLGYFYFTNKTKSTQLTATIDFVELVGTELLPPYSGSKPQVVVAPGEEKILIYKMTGAKAKANFRMMASFKKHVVDLGDKAKSEGMKLVRSDRYGQPLDITLYVLYHDGGLIALYENNTTDVTLVENVSFNLIGCKIEGMYGSSVRARVEPGKKMLVNILKTEDEFSANVTSCTYRTIKDYYY